MKQICMIIICMAGLNACGGGDSTPVEPDTVFDPMVEALDKAKAVEGLDQDRKRRMNEQLENN